MNSMKVIDVLRALPADMHVLIFGECNGRGDGCTLLANCRAQSIDPAYMDAGVAWTKEVPEAFGKVSAHAAPMLVIQTEKFCSAGGCGPSPGCENCRGFPGCYGRRVKLAKTVSRIHRVRRELQPR